MYIASRGLSSGSFANSRNSFRLGPYVDLIIAGKQRSDIVKRGGFDPCSCFAILFTCTSHVVRQAAIGVKVQCGANVVVVSLFKAYRVNNKRIASQQASKQVCGQTGILR